jgi:hypothetical protein
MRLYVGVKAAVGDDFFCMDFALSTASRLIQPFHSRPCNRVLGNVANIHAHAVRLGLSLISGNNAIKSILMEDIPILGNVLRKI